MLTEILLQCQCTGYTCFSGCERKYKYKRSLLRHRKTLHNKNGADELTHVNIGADELVPVHNDKQFVCTNVNCGKQFTKKLNLQRH